MKKVYLIFLMALIVGFIGCDNGTTDKTPFEGSWFSGVFENTMIGNTWTTKIDGVNFAKGTFTYTGTVYTATMTHNWDGTAWIIDTDTVTMDYVMNNNTMTITNHSVNNDFNGIWTKL